MKSNMDDELSLEKIDDYKGTESNEKKSTVKFVIAFCIVVGIVLAFIKSGSTVNDYVGTEQAPGIVPNKK